MTSQSLASDVTRGSADARDAFDYDGRLLDQMNRLQDRIQKFALQNYAAAGAIFLAYFTEKIPILAALVAIVAVGVNFVVAIGFNVRSLRVLWKMHRITLDRWFEERRELLGALCTNNSDIKDLLTTKELPIAHFVPVVIANCLPAAAIFIWWKWFV